MKSIELVDEECKIIVDGEFWVTEKGGVAGKIITDSITNTINVIAYPTLVSDKKLIQLVDNEGEWLPNADSLIMYYENLGYILL